MKQKASRSSRFKLALVPVAFIASSLLATPSMAAKFGVRVVDDTGVPIAGAAVCVGLQGNYKQFGAEFTDASGQVMLDVPNVPLLVTVSKDRFTGVRTTEPARGFNLLKQVKLMEGVPGPRCKAGSVLADSQPNPPSIKVSNISIVEGVYSTTLQPTVTGEPSHYRISTDSEFSDAVWQTFSNQIALVGGLSGADKVYIQMRKYEGSQTGWMEARSDVLTVRLPSSN